MAVTDMQAPQDTPERQDMPAPKGKSAVEPKDKQAAQDRTAPKGSLAVDSPNRHKDWRWGRLAASNPNT